MKIFSTISLSFLTLFLLATSVPAAELLTTATKAAAQSPTKGQWVAVHEGTGGVTVDRSNGDVYVVVTGKEIFKERGQGVWKSTDQGATFARVDGDVIGGRCETGYGLCHDPNGKRLYCFMLDGTERLHPGRRQDVGETRPGQSRLGFRGGGLERGEAPGDLRLRARERRQVSPEFRRGEELDETRRVPERRTWHLRRRRR